MPQKVHIVAEGENLSSIARKHGFVSYKEVYQDPSNKLLRINRPDPNVIHPKDTVRIPENPLAKLQKRLDTKRNLLRQFEDTKKELARKAKSGYDDAKFTMNSYDVASDVLTTVGTAGTSAIIKQGGKLATKTLLKATAQNIGKFGAATTVAGAAATYSNNKYAKAAVGAVGFTGGLMKSNPDDLFKMKINTNSVKDFLKSDISAVKTTHDLVKHSNDSVSVGGSNYMWWTSPSGVVEKIAGQTAEEIRDEEMDSIKNAGGSIVEKLKADIDMLERKIAELKKQGYSL